MVRHVNKRYLSGELKNFFRWITKDNIQKDLREGPQVNKIANYELERRTAE